MKPANTISIILKMKVTFTNIQYKKLKNNCTDMTECHGY